MKIFKIIFLHDEKIFLDNFWSFEKVYVSTFDCAAICDHISPHVQTGMGYVSKPSEKAGTPDFYNEGFILKLNHVQAKFWK